MVVIYQQLNFVLLFRMRNKTEKALSVGEWACSKHGVRRLCGCVFECVLQRLLLAREVEIGRQSYDAGCLGIFVGGVQYREGSVVGSLLLYLKLGSIEY